MTVNISQSQVMLAYTWMRRPVTSCFHSCCS